MSEKDQAQTAGPELLLPPFDERAVRRATRRGVVRTAAVAAVALTMFAGLLIVTSVGVGIIRTEHFFRVAYHGTLVAHPEYQMQQDGSCCSTGPLFGLTNLGLKSELRLRATPTGALTFPGDSIVRVTQTMSRSLQTNLDDSSANPLGQAATPLGEALGRGRPDPVRTQDFMRTLPDATLVSALVEFDSPLSQQAFDAFFDSRIPVEAVPYRSVPIFAVSPYESGDYRPITWPHSSMTELRAWADSLGPGDDRPLGDLGLPPASDIQRVAEAGLVYAFVLPRIPLPALQSLASDPAVRTVNVLAASVDTGRQYAG